MDAGAFLPPGFRFNPEDETLIVFLKGKILRGSQFPLIPEVDVYKTEPWLLPGIHQDHPHLNDRERYYFFRRERKNKNGKRPRRSMDDDVLNGGKWIANTGDKKIFNEKDRKVIIGFKKSLTFFVPPANKTIKTTREKKITPKKGDMIKTEWIMHEYTLFGVEFQEWAVCRIKNKAKEPKQDHQQQEQEQQQEGEEDHHHGYTYFEEAVNLQHQTDDIMSLTPPIASQEHRLPLSYNYVDAGPSSESRANNMHSNLVANLQEQQQQGQDQDYTYIQEAINSVMPNPSITSQDDHQLRLPHPHEPPVSYNMYDEDTAPSLESTANSNSNMHSTTLVSDPEQEQQQGQEDDSTYFDWSLLRDPFDYQHPDLYQPSDGFFGFNGIF
ncbi:hypothetical protein Tsubulata_027120 [Turnera subulata]|uniref:NAC domain-containing protein n=1 Tax=Turnera subulata TaxID=218843 RepID=A0A9Q0GH59_9ROSI|nr:hypothetical protein Tsubulata_027120 [Turnera subulata]